MSIAIPSNKIDFFGDLQEQGTIFISSKVCDLLNSKFVIIHTNGV
jgi:hypothetical protein